MEETVEQRRAYEWGPVCLGYSVSLPGGEHGRIDGVRVYDGGVELVVATSSVPRRLVSVRAHEIEAIFPGRRRIVVREATGSPPADPASVESAGGLLRLPPRNSLRIASPASRPA